MALGILITAVLIFALRGMFLGFSGVIARLLGLGLGYTVAYSYRVPVAEFISDKTAIALPPVILQLGAGIGLFVITLLLCGLVVKAIFTLLGKIIPGFKALLDKETLGGKITGATVNGALAGAIVLMGIWAFDKASDNTVTNDPLHNIASRFGDTVFSVVGKNSDFTMETFSSSSSFSRSLPVPTPASSSVNSSSFSSDPVNISSAKGSATIVSSSNPNRRLSIENTQEITSGSNDSGAANTIENPLKPDQLKLLLDNPELQSKALELMQNNPEKINQLLENPQLKLLLEKFTQ